MNCLSIDDNGGKCRNLSEKAVIIREIKIHKVKKMTKIR
jgi:hypothetical protein